MATNPIYSGLGVAGGAAPVPWWQNVNSALGKNSNLLLALGGAALGGDLSKLGPAAAAGSQVDNAYATSKKEDAQRQSEINQTAKWIATNYPQYSSLPPADGLKLAMQDMSLKQKGIAPTNDMQNYEYGLTHPDFAAQMTQKGGAAETALTASWGIDNDPNSPTYNQKVLGQLNKAGKFVRTAMPDGVTALDPVDLQGQKTGATVDAKTAANARASLQSAQQAFDVTQKTLNTLTTNPSVMAGQKENFGKLAGVYPQQMAPVIPGTNRANFKNIVDQLSGQAFLNIRQALKGAGQVTDYEGQKGEIALSRMKAAADSGDEQAFMQAVADYQDAINNGMELLRQTANGGLAAGQPAVTGGPTANDPLGIR